MQNGRQKHRKQFHKKQLKRSQVENDEIEAIERALAQGAPPRGSNPLSLPPPPEGTENVAQPGIAVAKRFDELPMSEYTKQGLREAKYINLTAVQRAALPHALCGRDMLGAAKTGSGKTLAFLLPVMEKLYRSRWSKLDGLGALVISPTRELALQIFDELRKVGRRHDFSAGLLIGGKDVKEEQARVHGMNILVCTPGRLLQHMDETPGFDASQLQILVLDEADRILDMGFSATLNAIVANIPRERQTLLFSATQTKSVKDLARLSLKDPEYISVHAEATAPTPLRLQQAYMVCELPQKLDILWSFIKTHLKAKTIVFVSTCKQVRFLFEAFRKLRPGVPLRALHGKMNQYKRMGAFYEFCEANAMVLFATDIAARGLDFPTVDWVVQADCPEDVPSYIHRVGRTARYVASGKGLLLLLPSEQEGMLAQLEEAKVPLKQLKHNPAKVQPVTPALQALLSKDAELKDVGQRALVSYLRSVFLQPNRKVFDVTQLPAAEFAYSMGLPTAPKLRFLKKARKKMQEVVVGGGALADKDEPASAAGIQADDATTTKSQQQQQRKQRGQHQGVANGRNEDSDGSDDEVEGEGKAAAEKGGARGQRGAAAAPGSDSEDDFLVVKRHSVFGGEAEEQEEQAAQAVDVLAGGSKKKKRLKIKPNAVSGSRVVFDDEGEAVDPLQLLAQDEEQFNGSGSSADDAQQEGKEAAADSGGLYTGIHASVAERAAAARALMLRRDRQDREQLREMRKQMRQEKRAKRLAREQAVGGVAVLASGGGGGSGELEESDSEGEGYRSSSDEEQHSGDDEAGSSGSDDERQQRGAGRGARRAAAASDSGSDLDLDLLLESSEDEGEEEAPRQRQQAKRKQQGQRGSAPEVAHLGMLPAEEAPAPVAAGGKLKRASAREAGEGVDERDDEAAAPEQKQRQKKRKKEAGRDEGAAGLSLAEQEALALRLLGARQ